MVLQTLLVAVAVAAFQIHFVASFPFMEFLAMLNAFQDEHSFTFSFRQHTMESRHPKAIHSLDLFGY